MRNYGRSLEKIKGERRITVFFLCDHCKVEVLVSRPARPGEKLGTTPKD